jgi:serine protease Do
MRELPLVVAAAPIGQTAQVTVWRRNAVTTLRPIIGEMPEGVGALKTRQYAPEGQRVEPSGVLGLKLAPLTPQRRHRLGVPRGVGGVVVTAIDDDSPFADLDLLSGDVIETINQRPVASPEDVIAKVQEAVASGRKSVTMLINRHGSSHYLATSTDNLRQDHGNG